MILICHYVTRTLVPAICHYYVLSPEHLHQKYVIATSLCYHCISNISLLLHYVTIMLLSAIYHCYVTVTRTLIRNMILLCPFLPVSAVCHYYVLLLPEDVYQQYICYIPLLTIVSAMCHCYVILLPEDLSAMSLLCRPVTRRLLSAIRHCYVVLLPEDVSSICHYSVIQLPEDLYKQYIIAISPC